MVVAPMKFPLLYRCALLAGFALAPVSSFAAGVTIITHGLNGNVDDWIIPMAERIPNHPNFPGASFSCYEIRFVSAGQGFRVTNEWIGGVAPMESDSGEILIKLDWRQLANNSHSTYEVAEMVVPQLLNPDFVPELSGHALAEWPLHLVGHSRGGSLVCEMSRLLGLQGVWVDHVTTLDPHPLNNDGFMDIFYTVVDATAVTYENVLFADNYFQELDFLIYGKDVPGAYVRELTSLENGYGGIGGAHSDVHLWYHGTLDLATPTTDSAATIGGAIRNDWWTAFEARGTNAGFFYSRIGGGDRLSSAQPVPSRARRIRDGMNQRWDFGAGTADNRTTLESNNGAWPNLIDLHVPGPAEVSLGDIISIQGYFQYGLMPGGMAELRIYLDADRNPLNGHAAELAVLAVPSTGIDQVTSFTEEIATGGHGLASGEYLVAGRISDGEESRWLYARDPVMLSAPSMPPVVAAVEWTHAGFVLSIEASDGATVVLEASPDFKAWLPLATNVMTDAGWVYVDETAPEANEKFYRAVAE